MESPTTSRSRIFGFSILAVLFFLTAIRNETWRSAKTLWSDVVLKSPALAAGHLNLAREYHLSGNYPAAVREYQLAMQLASSRLTGPDTFRARQVLALAQSNLGSLLVRTGDPHDRAVGETALRASLSLIPFYPPSVVWLSETWNEQHRYSESLSLIDGALQADPFGSGFRELGRIYFNKGVALCGLGFEEQANLNLQAAAALDRDLAADTSRRPLTICR